MECYCGNVFGSYGISNNCNAPCANNTNEICGGSNSNSIYETTNSLIDVLLHNQDLVTETKVINCPFSDHSFIAAKINLNQITDFS